MTIRILIADEHRVLRHRLRTFLEVDPELVVVGEAADGAEVVRLAEHLRPDIASRGPILLKLNCGPTNCAQSQ